MVLRIIGIVLLVLGLLGFIFGGISFTKSEEVVDLGPVDVEKEQTETIPITPLASGAAVVAGIALIYAGRTKE